MNQAHVFKLLDGNFTISEARSVLFTLVNSKIKFHSTESFGIRIRTDGDTSYHENRIKQLEQTKIDIRKLLDYADTNKMSLHIDGDIEIKLIIESEET